MKKKALAISAALALAVAPVAVPLALGASSQGGQPSIILNPGGGLLDDGIDGIRIHFNTYDEPDPGSDQVFFAGDQQWCCGGAGPVLAVGSTAFGEAGAAEDRSLVSWDTFAISDQTGTYEEIPTSAADDDPTSSAKGSASATLTYEKTVSSRVYRVIRQVTYVYPNNFYDEVWTLVIPSGNTEVIKLYVGGDSSPGDDDNGIGSTALRGSGLRAVYEANPDSEQYLSYAARDLASNFTHYFVGDYDNPFGAIASGGDLDDSIDTSEHDAGIQVQWTFGSTPGTFSRSMRTTVGYNDDIGSEPEPDADPAPTPSGSSGPRPEKVHVETLNKSPKPGQVVSMFGAYFGGVTEVFIGGVKVEIISSGGSRVDIRIPKGLKGLLDVELKSPLGTLLLKNHLNLGNLPSQNSNKATLVVGGFEPNSRKLTPTMKAKIERWLIRNSEFSTITCTGFTSLPRTTNDVKLSTKRGASACAFAKKERPDVVSMVSKGIEDPRPGSNVRRVRLVLTP